MHRYVILAIVYAAALLTVPLARGRLSALGRLRLRAPELALAAILAQVLIVSLLPSGSHALHVAVHIASYALLGTFAWLNRRLPGMPVIALGGLLNFAAIAANRGVMPADPDAVASLSHRTADGDFANSATLAHPKLSFLGDILATPASWPVHNVYSIGDVLIVLGVLVLLHVGSGSKLAPRRFAAPSVAG